MPKQKCIECGNLLTRDNELMFVNRCWTCGMTWVAQHGSNKGIENDLGDKLGQT